MAKQTTNKATGKNAGNKSNAGTGKKGAGTSTPQTTPQEPKAPEVKNTIPEEVITPEVQPEIKPEEQAPEVKPEEEKAPEVNPDPRIQDHDEMTLRSMTDEEIETAKQGSVNPDETEEEDIVDGEWVIERLSSYLASYPCEKVFHITSDGQVFLDLNKRDALNHQRHLNRDGIEAKKLQSYHVE